MYVNKCIKCGKEFETKNPKRVICPECLYSDKKYTEEISNEAVKVATNAGESMQGNSYSFGENQDERPVRNHERNERAPYNRTPNRLGQRDNRPRQGAGNFQRPSNNRMGQRPQRPGMSSKGGFRTGGNGRPQRGPQKPKRQRQLLISKEQLEKIEVLYKKALPLPNPDIHEVIGQAIELEPRKVFFGINLIRQKLMLPKLPFPKRKLAVSPDQLFAIKNLYEPMLPLPPIGCHKMIAVLLKMDEWRVHVGIGLVRKQMGLERWNQERADAPAEYKKSE